ncbi:hypothetical protein BLA60_37780 [Actinophytocola xinjiangensis]|uniref:DUF397 domain-containing protein n=1 Tax=Actinophytocola xinjiangensis TaxID=485602 RepID=A0A7Z1AV12_9PSEU|nr:DUF397 domain-containing protein [Actinophytocola xinjiangensis]OLF05132.1 hypothetical protein BLA60_37780 [Actinophytocola xinjiangensis]
MNPAWRRSSYSGSGGTGGGNCVEAARLTTGRFALRDSKNAATLTLPRDSFTALLRHVIG